MVDVTIDDVLSATRESAWDNREDLWQKASQTARKFNDYVRSKPHFQRIVWSRMFSEVGSITAAPLAAIVVDKALHRPYENLKNHVAKTIIEPNFEHFDAALEKAKSIEVPKEREKRLQLPKDEQARLMTDLLLDTYLVKGGGSLIGQVATQNKFTKMYKVNLSESQNTIGAFFDRAVQLGALIALNTVAADQSIAMQEGLTKMLVKGGMQQKEAQSWANWAINVQGSNGVALAASVALLHFMSRGGRKV